MQEPGGPVITGHTAHSQTVALIVAAGRGRRMANAIPKQFLELCGRPLLAWTIDAFLACEEIQRLMVVIHPDDGDLYSAAVAGIRDRRLRPPIPGGDTRASSVRCGLEAMANDPPDKVLIHDAARPFVTPEHIGSVTQALEDADGAFVAIPVIDALWTGRNGHAGQSVARDGLWRAQTPQGFRFEKILEAHRTCSTDAADDVAVARQAGLDVRIIEGSEANFKITTPDDLARAEAVLAEIR